MNRRKPPETENELLDTFTELFDEIEIETLEEADAILISAGYDPQSVSRKFKELADGALAKSPLNWRNQRSPLSKVKEKIASFGKRQYSGRSEMEKAARSLLTLIPQSQPVVAHYRNFEEMTDEDFSSWLEELEYLAAELQENE